MNLLINEPEEPETLVVTSCLKHKNLKVTDPINCITVRKVPLVTEKFDYFQLPNQSQINRTDWVRLILFRFCSIDYAEPRQVPDTSEPKNNNYDKISAT